MKILVGSKNPVKIEAVRESFEKYFENLEIAAFEVESGVSVQPVNDETFVGAQNRASNLFDLNKRENLNADFFVGIEGGIIQIFGKWFAFGCMCVMDKGGKVGYGTSPHFELPDSVIEKLLSGIELGDVMDEIMRQENTKQKMGAIGYFTNGIMHRKDLYIAGLTVAVIPFLHDKLYHN